MKTTTRFVPDHTDPWQLVETLRISERRAIAPGTAVRVNKAGMRGDWTITAIAVRDGYPPRLDVMSRTYGRNRVITPADIRSVVRRPRYA